MAAYLLPQLSPVGDNLVSLRAELDLEFANDGRRLLHRRHLQMEGTMRQVPLERYINIAVNGCSGFATSTQKGPFTATLLSRSRGTYLIEECPLLAQLVLTRLLNASFPFHGREMEGLMTATSSSNTTSFAILETFWTINHLGIEILILYLLF